MFDGIVICNVGVQVGDVCLFRFFLVVYDQIKYECQQENYQCYYVEGQEIMGEI